MKKFVGTFLALLIAVALVLGWTDSSFGPPKAPAKPVAWYSVEYPGPEFSKEERISMAVDSFEPLIYGRIADPVSAVKRLDQYDAIIADAATATGLPTATIRSVLFLESQGRTDAVVRYKGKVCPGSCAGIGQFAPGTARDQGLIVSKGWVSLYLAYQGAKNPVIRAKRWAKLQKYDQRFDPKLAIPATGRYLKKNADEFGGTDWGVAVYHMGPGNMREVLRRYRSGWDCPEKLYWPEVVLDVDPDRHPMTWSYLTSLEDDSVWYWFRVRKAESELALWHSGRAGQKKFQQLAGFYDWAAAHGRRDRLAQEYQWYHNDTMPVWEEKDIPTLLEEGSIVPIQTGKWYVETSGVTYPYLRPGAMGGIHYLQSEVRRMGGGQLTLTSAFRTYSQMPARKKSGKYSIHRNGYGTDLRIPTGRTFDALVRTLQWMRSRGEVVFYQESNPPHIHVTFAPKTDHVYARLIKGTAKYELSIARYQTWEKKWASHKPPTFWEAVWHRLWSWGGWGLAFLLTLVCWLIVLLRRPSPPPNPRRPDTCRGDTW